MNKKVKSFLIVLSAIIISLTTTAVKYTALASSGSGSTETDQTVTSNDNIVQKLFNMTMSMVGAYNWVISPDGYTSSIQKLPDTISNNVKEFLATMLNGGGIYVDESGDYVFTDEAVNGIYDALSSNSSVDARVVSNFGNFTTFSDGYVNAQHLVNINEIITWARTATDSSGYILQSVRYMDSRSRYIYTYLNAYVLNSNFGYFSADDTYKIKPYTLNGASTIFKKKGCYCIYTISSGTYSTSKDSDFFSIGQFDMIQYTYDNVLNFYNYFPNVDTLTYSNVNTNQSFYCNNSLLIAKNSFSANTLLNQQGGIQYGNLDQRVFNKNIVENNNWENIYNNYVINVNDEASQVEGITADQLRKIQKKYTDQIVTAIEQGMENIEETVSVTNKYLQSISVDVRNIMEYLQTNGGGGSSGGGLSDEQLTQLMTVLNQILTSCNNTYSDVSILRSEVQALGDLIDPATGRNIMEILNSIDSNSSDSADALALIVQNQEDYYSYLSNLALINQKMDTIISKIGSGGGGGSGGGDDGVTVPSVGSDILYVLNSLTDDETDHIAGTVALIGDLLKGAVPFCYLTVIGGVVNALGVPPEPPVFDVSFKSDDNASLGVLQVDETVDLTWVSDLRPYWIALECILFVLGLSMFTFTVFTTFGSLFS